jgi:hypothetical protein
MFPELRNADTLTSEALLNAEAQQAAREIRQL